MVESPRGLRVEIDTSPLFFSAMGVLSVRVPSRSEILHYLTPMICRLFSTKWIFSGNETVFPGSISYLSLRAIVESGFIRARGMWLNDSGGRWAESIQP